MLFSFQLCKALHSILSQNTFLINKEIGNADFVKKPSTEYHIVSAHCVKNLRLELARWRPVSTAVATSALTIRSSKDLMLLSSTVANLRKEHKLIIITCYPPLDGLREYVQKWRKHHNKIYVVMVNNFTDKEFVDELPNAYLTFNILNNVSQF